MAPLVPVLLGTARDGRRSVWVARYARDLLAARDEVETTLVDVRELPFGNLVRRVWEMTDEERTDEVEEAVDVLGEAAGFVVVFPEYNHGYPGALKNLFDHFYEEWTGKPFALVSVGGISGGLRAQEQMRTVVNALGVPIPRGVAVPYVKDRFTEEGPISEERADWRRRFDDLFDELLDYVERLGTATG